MGFRRGQTYVYLWLIHVEVWQKPTQYCEASEKVGLKLNIQKTKIMASSPITSWEIGGKTVETVSDFILGGSKITADVTAAKRLKDA